ncbi:hypothetical protein LCGC14_2751280 [marine sediment metagenome]|uniref:Uncharacterized protein n=1 Tax=marine sediment metagenome TaxID=412755 RepID=A0A0F8ZNQ6_9ZZZZ
MSLDKNELLGIIEPILFNEGELSNLKGLINDVGANKIEPKLLRKAIIDNRVSIMERLINTFFFQVKREFNLQEIDNFTGNNSQLQAELEQKNIFLEEIAERIQTIYSKAEEKFGVIG